ncbi:MAG: sensor histidine kinase [Flavobacteriales bacterium]
MIYNKKASVYISTQKEEIQNTNRRGAIFYQWSHFDPSQGDSAFYYLEKSMALSEKYGNTEFYINNLKLIATLWNNNKQNPELSLQLFKKALHEAKILNDIDLLVQINTNITMPLMVLKQYETAIEHLLSIDSFIEKLDIPIYRLNYYQKLSLIYRELKDYENEAKILDKELVFIRAFFNSEKAKNIAELEEKYESHLKDIKNKQLEQEGEQKSTIITIVLIGLFLSSLALVLYKRLNYKLKETNDKLNNSVQLNKRIFSILSHDLKQPIVSLESMFFLMDNQMLSEDETLANKKLIQNHLKTTSLFIDDIMTWAKLEIEKTEKLKEEVYVLPVLKHIEGLYSLEIGNKTLNIVSNIDKHLFIQKNKMLLFIILKNLIHNAIKFSFTQSTVVINTKKDKNKTIFYVENIGRPIPDYIKNDLFNIDKPLKQFMRNDSQLGFGLGLSIVSKLIYDNSGKIWLEQNDDKNKTTIAFYL